MQGHIFTYKLYFTFMKGKNHFKMQQLSLGVMGQNTYTVFSRRTQ